MKNDAKPLVLIVDDNPQNLQVLGSILSKNGYEPVVFLNGSDALAFLQQEPPSLVLLDVIMPEMDGYDVCRQIKSHPSTENIPVIFLTAKAQTQDLVQGFECGAVDYITKPFNSLELLSRVQTHVSLREMQKTLEDKNALLQKEISLRIEAEEKLKILATIDDLTGLYNRRHFMELLRTEFERTIRYNLSLSLMIIDVDYFKKINDKYGHDVGDLALKSLGALGPKALREVDVFGRIGGEEFAVFLPETNLASAIVVAERFLKTTRETAISIESGTIALTVSIGLSTYTKETSAFDSLIKKADMALYTAKDSGRDRVEIQT